VTALDAVPASGVRGRRGLTLAAAGCAVSGGVVLLAVGRVWVRYTVSRQSLAPRAATATGHGVAAAAGTLALVVLAGVLVLPATRGSGRRAAGVLIGLCGFGIGYVAAATISAPGDQVSGSTGPVAVTGWAWVTVAAGLVAIAAGVLTVVSSRAWPAMGRRYESGAGARRRQITAATPITAATMWDRLDEGDDPTA
jgi:uncharacterized membrane protein (TIGR02234 family)